MVVALALSTVLVRGGRRRRRRAAVSVETGPTWRSPPRERSNGGDKKRGAGAGAITVGPHSRAKLAADVTGGPSANPAATAAGRRRWETKGSVRPGARSPAEEVERPELRNSMRLKENPLFRGAPVWMPPRKGHGDNATAAAIGRSRP